MRFSLHRNRLLIDMDDKITITSKYLIDGKSSVIKSNHDEERTHFSWENARQSLDGLPGNAGLNIAYEAIDRHAASVRKDHIAIRWLSDDGKTRSFSYQEMARLTNRFANLLQSLGIGAGDRVFALMGRLPELYITALGTLKNRGVFCALFSAFGPEPLRVRLSLGKAKVLVTTTTLYRRKIQRLRALLPELEYVILVQDGDEPGHFNDTYDFHRGMETETDTFAIAPTDPEATALLHFTSGTTGMPKGAIHVHSAVIAHYVSGKFALDIHPDDVFWCTADPGWVTGISYGVIAPLVIGATLVVDAQEFEVERWYRLLQDEEVNVWYTSPTALHLLMRLGSKTAKNYDFTKLRFIASVGEPLDAETIRWGQVTLGHPVHDSWWQTETGAIMISNHASMAIKPGAMGKPLPGVEAAIVKRVSSGNIEHVTQPGARGELALRAGWPSMFRGYLDNDERYRRCFANGWYLTRDLAWVDEDGYYWFVGRADDMIKSAGHLIGPFEVENVLLAHPAVTDAAVIGIPDRIVRESVRAYVTLHSDFEPSETLTRELLAHARKRLGATVAPRAIEFREYLPKNRSGKTLRRVLKAQEIGLPMDNREPIDINS